MPTPLKVGLVGYGYAGRTFHAPLIAAIEDLELIAIASSNPGRVHTDWPSVAVEPSPAALYSRPELDLVVIATPNPTHAPLALAALAAGKHVVIDKPFCVSLEEAQRLREAAASCGRIISVFHNRRWDADFLSLRQLISAGTLGQIVYYESHFDRYRPEVRPRWREQAGPGSGIWYDLGPHLLDQALLLFGMPLAVSADLAIQRPGAQTDDYFHVQLRYDSLRVILHGTMLAPHADLRMVVHGSTGSYIKYGLDAQEEALKAGQTPTGADWGHDPQPGILTTYTEGRPISQPYPGLPGDYTAYYAAVREAIRGTAPNPVPAEAAISVMELLELAMRSAAVRREALLSQR